MPRTSRGSTRPTRSTPSLFVNTGQSPTDFYDGGFQFNQFVGTLDIDKEFEIGFARAADLGLRRARYRDGSYIIVKAGDALVALTSKAASRFPGYAQSDAGTIGRTAKRRSTINFITEPVDWIGPSTSPAATSTTATSATRWIGKFDHALRLLGRLRAPRHREHRAFRARRWRNRAIRPPTVGPTSRHPAARAELARRPPAPGSARSGRRSRSTSRPAR